MCRRGRQREQAASRSRQSAGRVDVHRRPQPPNFEVKKSSSRGTEHRSQSPSATLRTQALPHTQCRSRPPPPVLPGPLTCRPGLPAHLGAHPLVFNPKGEAGRKTAGLWSAQSAPPEVDDPTPIFFFPDEFFGHSLRPPIYFSICFFWL